MKTLLLAVLTMALAPAWGQKLELKLDSVAAKASEKTEVDLDGPVLAAVLKNTTSKGLDAIAANVTGVFVRSYEFANDDAFTDADLAPLRKQVAGTPGWSRIINVKEEKESTEIYMFSDAGKPAGFLLITAEPNELTVVHVQGAIQLAQLQELVQSSIQFDLKNLPVNAPKAQ